MSVIKLVVPSQIEWTTRLRADFVSEARVLRGAANPWGILRYEGNGNWIVVTLLWQRRFLARGQGTEIESLLRNTPDSVLLTARTTLDTARVIIAGAGHCVEVVNYNGTLKSG